MKDIPLMRMLDGFEKAIHVELDFHLIKVFIVDKTLVEILFHEFKDKSQLPRGFIIQDLNQLDDVIMRR